MKLVFLFQEVYKNISSANRPLKAPACLVHAVLTICFPDFPEPFWQTHTQRLDKVSDSPNHMWFSSTSSHAPEIRQTFRQEAHFLAVHPNFKHSAKYIIPQSLLPNNFAVDPLLLHAKKQKILLLYSFFYAL